MHSHVALVGTMGRETRATWAKRIEEWRQSGLDATAFAAKAGVSPRALRWWRWRVGAKAPARKVKSLELRRDAVTPMTFVELANVAESAPIEIVLRNEIRVRVGRAFDAAALARVLDLVERR